MNSETWKLINLQFLRFRSFWAEHVDASEFEIAYKVVPTSADYREFVMHVGGGIVGDFSFMANRKVSV